MRILYNITFLFISIVCLSQTEEEIEHNAQIYYYDFINPTQKYNNDNNISPDSAFRAHKPKKSALQRISLFLTEATEGI